MAALNDTFTSTGAKFFHHQEAMAKLRNGQGQPITTHVMLTDICNHTCAFCSVQHREGDSLAYPDVLEYLDTLIGFGLKSVILSGGGNPILYKCKKTGKNFNDVVDWIHARGLEIGLITNGMPLYPYAQRDDGSWQKLEWKKDDKYDSHMTLPEFQRVKWRQSWATVSPSALDKLTWVRISMSGLDHDENKVFVPDIDPSKTTLGFSYVFHDIWDEPADKAHGKVSTTADRITLDYSKTKGVRRGHERIPELTEQIRSYVLAHQPKYVRLLPNCLEPGLIAGRCEVLQSMADAIGPQVVFVQHKPPAAPNACYLGYVHPVLNCDGYVYPCDSCVLNEKAGHKFNETWRVCHWSEVASLYERPVQSLIKDPKKQCPGCVFTQSNLILEGVVSGTAVMTPPAQRPEHENFI